MSIPIYKSCSVAHCEKIAPFSPAVEVANVGDCTKIPTKTTLYSPPLNCAWHKHPCDLRKTYPKRGGIQQPNQLRTKL